MRRVESLITIIRRETSNTSFTTTSGIQDDEVVEFLNYAQDRIQSLVAKGNQNFFEADTTFSPVARQEAYDLPDDTYMGNRVSKVEFSSSGRVEDFHTLDNSTNSERFGLTFGDPVMYIRRNRQILLVPTPATSRGSIRLTYVRKLDRLDRRRATISAVTTGAGNTITSLTVQTGASLNATPIVDQCFACVVDRCGQRLMKSIPVDAIDTGTGVVTITPGFSFETGETIAVGDYLVAGKFATNMSSLPDDLERFIISYANWKMYKRDSSEDSGEASQELALIDTDLTDLYAEVDADIMTIPIISSDFTGDELL